ncbi:DUF4123 domain-containing protein [Dyella japonica]|uniref:DUF4123 domain-containing protein n=1 Tax=Dyella japonica TaxID=231455 RepID=A0ABV2K105_9GAMM
MTTVSDTANAGVPVMLGANPSIKDLPNTSFTYLLLHTRVLEDWAYQPSPPDASELSATAPGVVDLVRAVSPLAMRRWLWDGLTEEPERGPLLVDATGDTPLLEHALAHWAPVAGVLFIGAACAMDSMHQHLQSLTHFTMPDQGQAQFGFMPSHLSAWLNALDAQHRHAWLGPMSPLLWRENRGPAHRWYRLEQTTPGATQTRLDWLQLRADELAAFDHHVREHFIAGLASELLALPTYGMLSTAEAQSHVRETLAEAAKLNINADEDFRACVLLLARHPALQADPTAQALLNDLSQSPAARLRAVAALVNEKDLL